MRVMKIKKYFALLGLTVGLCFRDESCFNIMNRLGPFRRYSILTSLKNYASDLIIIFLYFFILIRFVFGPNLDESSNNNLCLDEKQSNDICMKASGLCETESSSMSLSFSKIIPNMFTKFLSWPNSI